MKAKEALDKLIAKQRVALYKPIQIAEVLYHHRCGELTIDDIMQNIETYRNPSKQWRDIVSQRLIGRVSTSSQRYQDNIFDSNAIPPNLLADLIKENINGIVERYIYQQFRERQKRILKLAKTLESSTVYNFDLNDFLSEFIRDKGIKRSIDKAYEIVVFALFNTLVTHLKAKVTLTIDSTHIDLLREFKDFSRLVLGLDADNPFISVNARLYRAGLTNAADRGLDMWTNFGSIVQVKHLTLTDELAEDICDEVSTDRIVIVCKDGEEKTIKQICQKLGQNIQGIITQNELTLWYNQALHGKFSKLLGDDLIKSLRIEFQNEFPYSLTFNEFYKERGYDIITETSSPFWLLDQE